MGRQAPRGEGLGDFLLPLRSGHPGLENIAARRERVALCISTPGRSDRLAPGALVGIHALVFVQTRLKGQQSNRKAGMGGKHQDV
ncbi:hypothetical protein LY78DRAFT_658635 [Colletotrichum sublineola]|nr:hypothetical protein LY78DRAFT_658635 [Colletotrichum sublineola]